MRLVKKGLLVVSVACVFLVAYHYRSDFVKNKVSVIQEGLKDFSSDFVRTKGGKAFIKLDGEWVNVEDIKIASWRAFEPMYLEYDGQEIYIGNSGLVNIIKFLSEAGLVEDLD